MCDEQGTGRCHDERNPLTPDGRPPGVVVIGPSFGATLPTGCWSTPRKRVDGPVSFRKALMASWIESHSNLRHHPKLFHLCELTGWSRAEAAGRLHFLWHWAIEHLESGNLGTLPKSALPEIMDVSTDSLDILDHLKQAGFVDASGGIHDWMDYVGRLIKDRERKRSSRQGLHSSSDSPRTVCGKSAVQNRTVQNQKNSTTAFEALVLETAFQEQMRLAHPKVNWEREVSKMRGWLVANPQKAKKSNWKRFVNGWLTRVNVDGHPEVPHGRPLPPSALAQLERERRQRTESGSHSVGTGTSSVASRRSPGGAAPR